MSLASTEKRIFVRVVVLFSFMGNTIRFLSPLRRSLGARVPTKSMALSPFIGLELTTVFKLHSAFAGICGALASLAPSFFGQVFPDLASPVGRPCLHPPCPAFPATLPAPPTRAPLAAGRAQP